MTVGKLDERITIRRDVLTSDGMGGDTNAPVDVVTIWAEVIEGGGGEVEKFETLNASAMTSFKIRYRDDIFASDYVLWRGVLFNIRLVPKVSPREMYIVIQAERGVA